MTRASWPPTGRCECPPFAIQQHCRAPTLPLPTTTTRNARGRRWMCNLAGPGPAPRYVSSVFLSYDTQVQAVSASAIGTAYCSNGVAGVPCPNIGTVTHIGHGLGDGMPFTANTKITGAQCVPHVRERAPPHQRALPPAAAPCSAQGHPAALAGTPRSQAGRRGCSTSRPSRCARRTASCSCCRTQRALASTSRRALHPPRAPPRASRRQAACARGPSRPPRPPTPSATERATRTTSVGSTCTSA